ncbi:MAG: Holliday junction resolvase Hjc [Candidatus Marsarchaeota archaeon]|nr:Holliday junction resolvase Hjc [Candidatus Marsarchaeota archaeon]
MNRYVKGARGERELMDIFYKNGYSVMRSAGSGVNSISPDIISYKGGRGLAFECKAWAKSSLSIDVEKFDVLKGWESNTSMETFIAWKMNNKGWFFIKLDEMSKASKSYTVTRRRAMLINRRIGAII